jgi:hypothetical protein
VNAQVIAGFSGVLGALSGASFSVGVTYLVQRRSARRDRVLRLYEEWQSEDMLSARVPAYTILRGNASMERPDNVFELRDRLGHDSEDWTRIVTVIHFLHALGALFYVKAIDIKLFERLFIIYTRDWTGNCVDPLLRATIGTSGHATWPWQDQVAKLRGFLFSSNAIPDDTIASSV